MHPYKHNLKGEGKLKNLYSFVSNMNYKMVLTGSKETAKDPANKLKQF